MSIRCISFFQALASCLAYYCSPLIHLHWQLLILTVTIFLATITFFAVSIFGDTPESQKSRKISQMSVSSVIVNAEKY